ncbi:saccharopine dehydrogenase NADP-binding domain-containing protein [Mesorhizobium sp. M1312]|uniref:saccharopine dehydrogenase NADP-binding domain-containing protein n=1 Tax=unclassified Mesorhizobium TaxID=325217 RepID=UPI003338BA3B
MSSFDPHSVRTAIYGATGYTGRLIARHAVTLGLQPTLAGRNEERVAKLASVLNCPSLTFPIRSASQLSDCLHGFSTVLNCAGPFSQTARPMMEACIAAKADYLDITGEIDVIECCFARSLNDAATSEFRTNFGIGGEPSRPIG